MNHQNPAAVNPVYRTGNWCRRCGRSYHVRKVEEIPGEVEGGPILPLSEEKNDQGGKGPYCPPSHF